MRLGFSVFLVELVKFDQVKSLKKFDQLIMKLLINWKYTISIKWISVKRPPVGEFQICIYTYFFLFYKISGETISVDRVYSKKAWSLFYKTFLANIVVISNVIITSNNLAFNMIVINVVFGWKTLIIKFCYIVFTFTTILL